MKRLRSLVLCLLVFLSLCACRDSGEAPEDSSVKTVGTGSSSAVEEPVLTQPPAFELDCDQGYIYLLRGTYTWQFEGENGEMEWVSADSPHPLEMQEELPRLNGQGKASIPRWIDLPDEVTVRAWPDTAWGDLSAESQEVPWEKDGITLLEGGWIYELHFTWDRERYSGDAYYCFYGVNTPEALAQEEDGTLWERPPELTVSVEGAEPVAAAKGPGGEWFYEFEESHINTGDHWDFSDPLEEQDSLPQLVGGGEVTLSWESPDPEYLTVTALSQQEEREVPVEGNAFTLLEGKWVYRITGVWNSHNNWGGTGVYAFTGIQ